MIDTAIWVLVVLVGIVALGVAESARSGRLAKVNWGAIKTVAVTTVMVLLGITSALLVVVWTVVVLLVEIWQPLLIFVGAITGSVVMILLFIRKRPMFYVSALVAAAAALLLLL